MKKHVTLINIILIICILATSLLFVGCVGNPDNPPKVPEILQKEKNLVINTTPTLSFRKIVDGDEIPISNQALPCNGRDEIIMLIDVAVDNISDKEEILSTEITIGGAKGLLEAQYISGSNTKDQEPDVDNKFEDTNNNPGLKIDSLEVIVSQKTRAEITFKFRLSIVEKEKLVKPMDVDVEVDFNINENVSGYGYFPSKVQYVVDYQIDQPENVRIENKKLVWDSVENNNGYKIKIDDEEYVDLSINHEYYDISSMIGEHTFKIITKGDGKNNQNSAPTIKVVNIKKLDIPVVNVSKENNKITWLPVKDADYYMVNINNAQINVTGCEYIMGNISTGNNVVKVIAKNNKVDVFESDPSEPIVLKKLEAPIIRRHGTGTTFDWDAVADAEKYLVYIDDVFVAETSDLSYKATEPGTDKRIYIVAVNSDYRCLNSDKSNTEFYQLYK